MPQSAQLVLALDSAGNLLCETVGDNGARVKIALDADWKSRNPEIMAALLERQDAINRRERAKLREQQSANIEYVAKRHGVGTAARIWGSDPEKIFNRSWRNHLKGVAGNLNPATAPKSPDTAQPKKRKKLPADHVSLDLSLDSIKF